jgi:hypothetical protein
LATFVAGWDRGRCRREGEVVVIIIIMVNIMIDKTTETDDDAKLT